MKYTLDALRIPNGYYIPDRFKEGYGLSAETVRKVHAKGYTLIITVDNGVKAHEALLTAKELGIDVIVTDHHMISEEVEADIVVHPDYMEDRYQYFSGAGVALEISRNLIGEKDSLTAMAAVAAIGDVMPLWKETRKLVMRGIEIMKTGKPRPLCFLLPEMSDVTWTSIAFQIVPKLNSVGRLGENLSVNSVVRYLLSKDALETGRYAGQLNKANTRRKELSNAITKEAEKLVKGEPMEIIFREDFHEGICGLAAGRLASSLHRPVIVMGGKEDLIRGSGRSVPGFNMFRFFEDFDNLEAFGGHEQAVGITVRKENFEDFEKRCREKAEKENITEEEILTTAILVKEEDITMDALTDLKGNLLLPKEMNDTLFAIRNPETVKVYSSEKVTKLTLESGLEAVFYASKGLMIPDHISLIAGRLSLNHWGSHVVCQIEAEYVE